MREYFIEKEGLYLPPNRDLTSEFLWIYGETKFCKIYTDQPLDEKLHKKLNKNGLLEDFLS